MWQALGAGDTAGSRQSPCSHILVGAGNDKQVNKTWILNRRLWQVLEENKTEGSDKVRGARMNSLCDERRHHREGDSELRVEVICRSQTWENQGMEGSR